MCLGAARVVSHARYRIMAWSRAGGGDDRAALVARKSACADHGEAGSRPAHGTSGINAGGLGASPLGGDAAERQSCSAGPMKLQKPFTLTSLSLFSLLLASAACSRAPEPEERTPNASTPLVATSGPAATTGTELQAPTLPLDSGIAAALTHTSDAAPPQWHGYVVFDAGDAASLSWYGALDAGPPRP